MKAKPRMLNVDPPLAASELTLLIVGGVVLTVVSGVTLPVDTDVNVMLTPGALAGVVPVPPPPRIAPEFTVVDNRPPKSTP